MTQKDTRQKPVFLTQNSAMKDLVAKIKQVAKTRCSTLLITGENGTGKEVVAQLFHYYSSRRDKPMVAVNCGAIPSELVESELFGHEKGAFTGAHVLKEGCFEQADGGVLFLDEIREMPKASQVKLLRVVETGSFRRVGGEKEIQVNITLVSATNKILMDQVKSGNFREDLFYRINVIELYVPSLRHRKEDIPLLINYYKEHFINLYSSDNIMFSDACMDAFMAHDWPGNIQELKNVVERCVVLSDGGKIDISTMPPKISEERTSHLVNRGGSSHLIQIPIGTSLEKNEQEVIGRTLHSVDNNKTEAAKRLGVTRKMLHNKLNKYKDTTSNGA